MLVLNKNLQRNPLWVSFFAFCLLVLVGCQAKPPQGLTPEQIAALQEQGFKLTDNGLPSESTILHAGILPSNTKTIVHFNIRYCPHFLSAYKYAYHDIQGSEMARQDLTQHFGKPWTLSII